MRRRLFMFLIGLGVLVCFIVNSQAQPATVKGNYCGSTYGSGAGTFSFKVGDDKMDFEMEFRDRTVRRVRFDINKVKVSITGTVKRRHVDPCDMDMPEKEPN